MMNDDEIRAELDSGPNRRSFKPALRVAQPASEAPWLDEVPPAEPDDWPVPSGFEELPPPQVVPLRKPNGHAARAEDRPAQPERRKMEAATGEPEAPEGGWPEPLDIIGAPTLVGWPELTADCLPPPLFSYVQHEAERLNVDPCPLAGHVLAACAASISDELTIRPKKHDTWTQQARVWVCVVKDVGARGTEMIRSAFWPVRERDAALFAAWRQDVAGWKERQPGQRRGQEQRDDPEPRCQRLVTNDATIEAMSEILKDGDEHGKLTLLCDELVSFLGGFGRYTERAAAARALMLESYDGGPQRVDRVKRGHVFVPNWSVVVAGNIQPRRLAGMAGDLIDDGLFQRFITVHTKPARLGADDDRPLDPRIGRSYRELHQVLAQLKPVIGAEGNPMPCFVDPAGHDERQRLMRLVERLQVDPTLPTIIRETAPKWSGLLARLTLVFHLVAITEQRLAGASVTDGELCRIDGDAVATAATFLRRIALPNLFRLGFETLPEEGAPAAHARWLAGHILAHEAQSITAREIGRAYRPLRGKPYEVEAAMGILIDAGWTTQTEGRHDSQCWLVNPAVHGRFAEAAAQEKIRRAAVIATIRTPVLQL